MKSLVMKRSIVIDGHKTSVSLEDAFWQGLKDIARRRHVTLSELIGGIERERRENNLSSTLRLFVLEQYQASQHPTPGRQFHGDMMTAAGA